MAPRTGSKVLRGAVAGGMLLASTYQLLPSSFVPEPRPVDRRAVLGAAAALAAAAGRTSPAEAAQAKFSVFGFSPDGTGAVSDAYSNLDIDAPSPYSQFSNPKGSTYTSDAKVQEAIMARQKSKVIEYVKGLDKVPEFIRTKQSENLKSLLTLKMYMLRDAMEYVTSKGAPFFRQSDAAGMREADEFFQDIADLGVANAQRNWESASNYYERSKSSFKAWKDTVQL